MRLIVGIRVKNHITPESREPRFGLVRQALSALERVQPWPAANTTQALQWVPGKGRTAVIYRSNEPESVPERGGWLGNKQRCWAWTGVMGADTVAALRGHDVDRGTIDDPIWDGIGSFATLGATPDTLAAYTNTHRSEAMYWIDLPDALVISNSAAALSLMRNGGKVEPSRLGIAGFIMHGLPITDTVPFLGVQLVPAGAKISGGAAANIAVTHDPGASEFAARPYAERVDSLADSLVSYARMLSNGVESVAAAATGGKDSRLVISALHAAGVGFSTYTNGLPESGEAHVGKSVAKLLGIEHVTQVPRTTTGKSGKQVIAAEPERQAWQTLRSTGGLGNAFTVLPNPSQQHVSPLKKANFGGQGGEIIRGGFLRYMEADAPSADRTLDILTRYWTNNRDLLQPFAQEAVLADFRPIFDSRWSDPGRTLFEGYITNRTGRWLATMRHGESVVAPHATLLINNQLVRRLKTFSTEEMRSEKVSHSLMSRLAPGVQDLPFFRDRWAFEKAGPSGFYDPNGWDARAPHTAHEQPRANFNWRSVYGRDLSGFFKSYILGDANSALFDVVDRRAVERMLGGRQYRAPAAWALFSAQYSLNGGWLSAEEPRQVEVVEIEVPD
ncbi:hypothetical protein L332_11760 [Agrococcus pavilionensis RW1]|uniref:Asparagine synthetase domain-containing protein n=1 Tax=Agrococcus pavilionensis RW1 TaxID=1330458 RepID=U1MT33_9MICO|nr:hypothetical protein [Agrococcus pavilionensis]ERG65111.1 hypothetical protein L332_11760 [Agrococcus pavilionensis RW1]